MRKGSPTSRERCGLGISPLRGLDDAIAANDEANAVALGELVAVRETVVARFWRYDVAVAYRLYLEARNNPRYVEHEPDVSYRVDGWVWWLPLRHKVVRVDLEAVR